MNINEYQRNQTNENQRTSEEINENHRGSTEIDEDQTESNNRNKRFVQENIFYEPLRTWTSGHSNERFFTSDEAIIESGIKEREQIRNYDFKIAKDALESLGYVQEEKRINGVKARWWFKQT